MQQSIFKNLEFPDPEVKDGAEIAMYLSNELENESSAACMEFGIPPNSRGNESTTFDYKYGPEEPRKFCYFCFAERDRFTYIPIQADEPGEYRLVVCCIGCGAEWVNTYRWTGMKVIKYSSEEKVEL